MSNQDPNSDEFMWASGGVIVKPQPAISPDLVIERITVSKHSIVAGPAIEPDSEVAEYVNQMIRRAEGNWFGKLFNCLFDACPSPLAEDYRRLSVDQARHCVS